MKRRGNEGKEHEHQGTGMQMGGVCLPCLPAGDSQAYCAGWIAEGPRKPHASCTCLAFEPSGLCHSTYLRCF